MSVDNVQGGDKTVTYIKGKPVLVEQKTSEKTTGSIMVSDETTLSSSIKTNPNEVVIFPKKEKAVKENGEIVLISRLIFQKVRENGLKNKELMPMLLCKNGTGKIRTALIIKNS